MERRASSPVIAPAGEKPEGGGSVTHSPARRCPTFRAFHLLRRLVSGQGTRIPEA